MTWSSQSDKRNDTTGWFGISEPPDSKGGENVQALGMC